MKLSDFIAAHMDEILVEWDRYARKMKPAANDMDGKELRDHAEQMLREIAREIEEPPTQSEHQENAQVLAVDSTTNSAAARHGELRQEHQFTLQQVVRVPRCAPRYCACGCRTSARPRKPSNRWSVSTSRSTARSPTRSSLLGRGPRRTADLFIAVLGHDLRGPLATLSMTGGLLVDPRIGSDRLQEIGNSVTRATRQMTSMVNDLLGFTRTKLRGGMPIDSQWIDLLEVCKSALAEAPCAGNPSSPSRSAAI